MSNLNEAWEKIAHGFECAGLPKGGPQLAWLKQSFDDIPKETLKKVIDAFGGFGMFAGHDEESKERRDLSRAMNFALLIDCAQNRVPFKVDAEWRRRINDKKKTTLKEARIFVRMQADAIYSRRPEANVEPPYMPPEPEPAKRAPAVPIVKAVMAPISQLIDPPAKVIDQAAIRRRWRAAGIAVKAQVAFSAHGQQARLIDERMKQEQGLWMGVWNEERRRMLDVIKQQTDAFMFNFSAGLNNVSLVYKEFEADVAENQNLLKHKVEMIGQMFQALNYAPPPFSLIGAIGGYALKQVHVKAGLDVGSSYRAASAGAQSGLMQQFVERVKSTHERLDEVRTLGSSLSNIQSASTLGEALEGACAAQLKLLHSVYNDASDAYFGSGEELLKKFRSLRDGALAPQRHAMLGEMRGQRPGADSVGRMMDEAVTGAITSYRHEAEAQLKAFLDMRMATVDASEFKYAIALMLYSQYIKALFGKGDAEQLLGKPVSDKILSVFARGDGAWGVLMLGDGVKGATEKAYSAGRLVWKNDKDHKKILLMFCDWYLQNIEPFMMVVGAQRNGKLYDGALVRQLCEGQVRKLNAAIESGRKSGAFGKSWDWKTINATYRTLCG